MNDDRQLLLEALSNCRRVLVTTHVRPDGDALGTCAAFVMGLRTRGIEATVLLLSHLPSKYAFIFNDNKIHHVDVEQGWPPNLSLNIYDALLVLDTASWSQLPGLKQHLDGWKRPRLVVDHHLTHEHWADIKVVRTQYAAAGEIVAELLDLWQVKLDAPIATALFLAIASDTGWFQYSNTRPQTMRLAATLMEAGVDTDRMYQLLYQNERPQRLAIQTRAQDSLELLADGRLAVMQLHKDDFTQSGAGVGDTESLVNIPLQVRGVEVSILITEALGPADPVRISLRSKGQVDVARFAEQFGGGGHARAAGIKIQGSLPSAHDAVVFAMTEQLAKL